MAADTSSMSTSGWMKFFCNAGIPSVVAGNYAVLFTKHRMHMDMLSDLSMEILNAIGINVMGDVIAILKHAKELHTQVTREKALASEQNVINEQQNRAVLRKSKMIQPSNSSQPSFEFKSTMTTAAATTTTSTATTNRRTIISLKRSSSVEEIPTQKVRRVLPEHEGPYTIKMPLGATPKTRRLLAQQGIAAKKVSVFDRLGDSKVSSTTGNGQDSTKITITNFGRSVVDSSTNKVQSSSVFDRLGPSKSQVSSTSTEDEEIVKTEPPLQYVGVFKNQMKHAIKITSQQGIRTAEATSTNRNLAQDKMTKKVSVLSRLGSNTAQSTQAKSADKVFRINNIRTTALTSGKIVTVARSDGILASGTKTKKISVLSRLGQKKLDAGEKKMISSPLIRVIKKKITADSKVSEGPKMVVIRKVMGGGNVIKRVRTLKKTKVSD